MTCKGIGWYPETEAGKLRIINCENDEIGNKTRFCSNSSTPEWSEEEVNCSIFSILT